MELESDPKSKRKYSALWPQERWAKGFAAGSRRGGRKPLRR
jgi:hypothetical protein